jgi:hypothetical protein
MRDPVAEPDPLHGDGGSITASAGRDAGVEHSGGDVLERRHRILEMEALEHEPELVRTQARELGVRGGDDVTSRPATCTSPLLGRSKVPSTVNMVVFPDPDAPPTATCSPAAISTLTPRSACTPPGYSFPTSRRRSAVAGDS